MQLTKAGRVVESVDDWFLLAPPKKGRDHWVDGRSAKELAVAWFPAGRLAAPSELAALFASHPDTKDIILENGEPEAQIRFDKRRGEPRNADLALRGLSGSEAIAITVEAKADEPFGDFVPDVLADALDRRLTSPRSGGVDRVWDLARALLPPHRDGLPPLRRLRYQLLTGTAGSLAWASTLGARRAVFVIHEFHTTRTAPAKIAENGMDLDAFVARLTNGSIRAVNDGTLIGPLSVPGAPLFAPTLKLYIGKVVRHVGGRT